MDTPEAAKDEQQRGDHLRLITGDDNMPTGADSMELPGIGLMLGVSPAGGMGWRLWMMVCMVGGFEIWEE